MDDKRTLNRREFLGTAAAASAFTIVPRHVLGGPGRVAPNDKITLGLIGSGTMALNLLMEEWLPHEAIQFTAVCDPNRDSTDYRDWSRWDLLYRMRDFLKEPNWGDPQDGIRAGREVGKFMIETYYAKNRPNGTFTGCRPYEDFRELLATEKELDGCVIMTPEHLHGTISIAAMRAGKHAIMHKTLANVFHEAHLAAETARTSSVVSHLLAWYDEIQNYQLADWIGAGVIGNVREIHNWSMRPVWPQGWLENPEGQPVPDGLRWDLWLGPVPDRPYHLNYTHALFRGWYDFGSGCLGDMGQYSLWRLYRILHLGAPEWVEGFPGTDARVVDGVSGPTRSQVSFPKSGTIRFRHPARGDRPAVDVYWYDGGVKPATPDELIEDGEELAPEGMLIVGDSGKILCGFLAENPRLIPAAKQKAFEGSIKTDPGELVGTTDEWVNAIKNGTKSRGSFEEIQPLAEATCLGNVALRMGRRLHWDAEKREVTNLPEANALLRREYRPGWEL